MPERPTWRAGLHHLSYTGGLLSGCLMDGNGFRVRRTALGHAHYASAGSTAESPMWYAALHAAPRGIVVACPVSGTLYARLSRGVPRVLRIEHSDCVISGIGRLDAQNGPIEIVLGEASLAPSYLLSIRLGDELRDHVVLTTPLVGTFRQDAYRNLRLTGVLPSTREDTLGFFPGRAAASYDMPFSTEGLLSPAATCAP